VGRSGGERRKIRSFDRQKRVFFKFWFLPDPIARKVTDSGFFIQWMNEKFRSHTKHTEKKEGCRSLSNKPFFPLTILSYKIFNFEQAIVHILRTYPTTGLDRGRA